MKCHRRVKKPRISDLPNLPSASLPICQVTDLENGNDDDNDDDDDDDNNDDDDDLCPGGGKSSSSLVWPGWSA